MNTVQEELAHSGVLGMKWGHRKSQKEDGTLTKSGQRKVSAQYKKHEVAGDKELLKNFEKIHVDAYNKAADKMNNGGINKFNASQKKKYGKDFRNQNRNYQKADALVKKYDMTKWNDLAKGNQEAIDWMRANMS